MTEPMSSTLDSRMICTPRLPVYWARTDITHLQGQTIDNRSANQNIAIAATMTDAGIEIAARYHAR